MSDMIRRRFFQSILAVVGLGSIGVGSGAPAAHRLIRIQTSPIESFQYHNGEAVWELLKKAVRVDFQGHKLGYVPRNENRAVAQLLDRGEKLSARVTALEGSANPWERVRFAILLQG